VGGTPLNISKSNVAAGFTPAQIIGGHKARRYNFPQLKNIFQTLPGEKSGKGSLTIVNANT